MAKKKRSTAGHSMSADRSAKLLAKESAQRQTVRPGDRMRYSLTITASHFKIDGEGAFDVPIREALDEPFEQQHMLFSLNTVEGPWAQMDSGNAFRWLPVLSDDLTSLEKVSDFVRLVFSHLVPAA